MFLLEQLLEANYLSEVARKIRKKTTQNKNKIKNSPTRKTLFLPLFCKKPADFNLIQYALAPLTSVANF